METARLWRHADIAATWAIWAGAVIASSVWLWHSARAVSLPFPIDYGEGPLLDQAARVAHGARLYPAPANDYPYVVANYPPLFPVLLAVVGRLFGNTFPVGRALVLVATATCAILIAAIAWTRTRDPRVAAAALALFLACPYVVFWSAFVRVDFVALAFALAAILVAVRRPDARWTPPACAGLALAAATTRQTFLFAAPIAIAACLLAARPARAIQFVALLGGGSLAALLALQAATGGAFWFHIITANVNSWSVARLVEIGGDLVTAGWLVLAVAGLVAWRTRREGPAPLCLAAYLCTGAVSALAAGKAGSSLNYFLEVVAAVCILAGTAAARGCRLAAPIVALQVIVWVGTTLLSPRPADERLAQTAEYRRLAQLVGAEPTPILADDTIGLLPCAGRSIALQPFEFRQLAAKGVWDEAKVVADVRARRFGLILIYAVDAPSGVAKERWSPAMLAAIRESYAERDIIAGTSVFRPR